MVPAAHARLVRTTAREARLRSPDEGDYGGADGEVHRPRRRS